MLATALAALRARVPAQIHTSSLQQRDARGDNGVLASSRALLLDASLRGTTREHVRALVSPLPKLDPYTNAMKASVSVLLSVPRTWAVGCQTLLTLC